jgi:hypothetical protein
MGYTLSNAGVTQEMIMSDEKEPQGSGLVKIPNPAEQTDAEINDVTGGGLKKEKDGTNNEAAAENMVRNREAAKGKK